MNKNLDFEEIAQAYQVIGLPPGAAFDDIKKEYRNLAMVFHPDKYEAGSTRQTWAQDKLIQINDAYEILKEFYEKYPDGVRPNGWKTTTAGSAEPDAGGSCDSSQDDSVDWRDWESLSKPTDDLSLEEWEKRQAIRQNKLKQQDAQNAKEKLILYTKIAAVVFVLMLWMGRVSSHDLHKASAESNWAALKERQNYDRERQGTDIDGLNWNNSELQERFAEQDTQLIDQNEETSDETQLTGWCTVIFTILVVSAVIAGFLKPSLKASFKSLFMKGGKHETA